MKQMFSMDDKEMNINYSSLSQYIACPMKFKFNFIDGLFKDTSSKSANFGTSIHKALESFYTNRNTEEANKAFMDKFVELDIIDEEGRLTIENGIKLLNNYYKTYENDGYKLVEGFAEKEFKIDTGLITPKGRTINLFGTIDAIVTDSNGTYVLDHKTTRTLGSQFINTYRVSHQMSAYIYAAKQITGDESINTAIINGLQIAKTKSDLVRTFFTMSKEQEFEFLTELKYICGLIESGLFFRSGGSTCGEYGGCNFLDLCSCSYAQREISKRSYL